MNILGISARQSTSTQGNPRMAASLCSICKTIPWTSLPRFPREQFEVKPAGEKSPYVQVFTRRQDGGGDDASAATTVDFAHGFHQDKGGLWQHAMGGCPLCFEIQLKAQLVVDELERQEPEKNHGDWKPSFNLWVTMARERKDPPDDDGGLAWLWVLSDAHRRGGGDGASEEKEDGLMLIAGLERGDLLQLLRDAKEDVAKQGN